MRRLLVLVVLATLVVACRPSDRDTSPVQESPDAPHGHVALHGGVLLEVGEHAANVELLLDAATGTLTLWALDGHAESGVRLPDKSIPVDVTVGGVEMALRLHPVASALSGEKVGDTSEFSVQHEKLKGAKSVKVRIPKIVILGAEGIVLEAEVPAAR